MRPEGVPGLAMTVLFFTVMATTSADEGWERFDADAAYIKGLQELRGTYVAELNFFPVRRQGQLEACEYTFILLARDPIYRNNQPIGITARLSYQALSSARTVLMLSVNVVDIKIESNRGYRRAGQVHSAYLGINGRPLADIFQKAPDTEIDDEWFFAPDPDFSLLNKLMGADSIEIWFSREKNEPEVRSTIYLREYSGAKSDSVICLGELALEILGPLVDPGE